jgi:hypothetical protein
VGTGAAADVVAVAEPEALRLCLRINAAKGRGVGTTEMLPRSFAVLRMGLRAAAALSMTNRW